MIANLLDALLRCCSLTLHKHILEKIQLREIVNPTTTNTIHHDVHIESLTYEHFYPEVLDDFPSVVDRAHV